MDTAVSKELETIKQAILDTVNANEIYLFGSYANGTPHKDSDFDIYVVIPDDSMYTRHRLSGLWAVFL